MVIRNKEHLEEFLNSYQSPLEENLTRSKKAPAAEKRAASQASDTARTEAMIQLHRRLGEEPSQATQETVKRSSKNRKEPEAGIPDCQLPLFDLGN